jgi:adenylate kinase
LKDNFYIEMNNIIKLHDKFFNLFITADKINQAIESLVHQVHEDLEDETPVFVGILNGSFIFVADFIRKYPTNCEVNFVRLASYEGTISTGTVTQIMGLTNDVTGKTVVILEDIIDTGNTLAKIYDIFKTLPVKQLKLATLFFKPDVFKKELPIDYIGLSIPDRFIVGYGLDYNEFGRNFKDIYELKTENMKNIVLFGHPGAGKGTQAEILKERYKLIHISTGDVFRFNIANNTDLGRIAKSFMDNGELVPDSVTIEMLKDEVNKHRAANGFIFDGFPRTISQADALEAFLAEKGEIVNGMVALEVPEDILVSRILERGKTSGRPDDQSEEKIRIRFNEYENKTAVLKGYYQDKGKYYGINGVGTIDEITNRLKNVIDNL